VRPRRTHPLCLSARLTRLAQVTCRTSRSVHTASACTRHSEASCEHPPPGFPLSVAIRDKRLTPKDSVGVRRAGLDLISLDTFRCGSTFSENNQGLPLCQLPCVCNDAPFEPIYRSKADRRADPMKFTTFLSKDSDARRAVNRRGRPKTHLYSFSIQHRTSAGSASIPRERRKSPKSSGSGA